MNKPQRTLGRYELLRRVATGGMGEIYLARTRGAAGFEKLVIIKTILPHLAEEEEFVTKFLDEGRIVVQLTHGNIVPVFDMGEENGEYFIAMEYVPGLDLRAVLKRLDRRGEQLPVECALHIASEICKGLGYAHRKTDDDGNPLGIVHRDVSPSNVLISREGEVKIIDFGIARAAGKVAQTASGRIQGKCCYMSPEQARGKPLDARSDIFSTGVLLYEMLTGVRPFEGRSDLESLELVRQCEVDSPGVLRPELSEDLDQIVCRALEADPADRYQATDDLLVDLQQEIYRQGHTVTSQRLGQVLEAIFDEEPVDDESPRPANLDEAFELELAKLGTGSAANSESSPAFAATVEATPETRTMSSTPLEVPNGNSSDDTASSDESRDGSGDDDRDLDIPQGDDETESGEAPEVPTSQPPRLLSRRHLVITAVIAVVLSVSIAAAFILIPESPREASLYLDSEPAGAQIHLDGDELAGRRTPDMLTLAPGEYAIELTLDEHLPRRFRVTLEPGEQRQLNREDLVLPPRSQPVRHFTVHTDPGEAELIVDGEPRGTDPQQLELEPGDLANLSARAPDCSSVDYVLSYRHRRDDVVLSLDCDDPELALIAEADDLEEHRQTASESSPTVPQYRSIRIDTTPSGAEIVIDDEFIGTSPLLAELRLRRPVTIEAHHDGFESYRRTTRPEEIGGDQIDIALREQPQGCLTFRAVYPAHNEIAVNGLWLEGRHATLQEHPLPAGSHTITVRHPESDKEESFQVDIEAGDDCAILTVWQPE